MALGAGDVYSLQAPGLATNLGSSLGALRVVQQEAYKQAHQRAQQAKAAADLEKSLTLPVLNMNGSQYFQPEIDASAKQFYDKAREYSQQAVNGKISRFDYLAAVNAEKARHDGVVQRSADAGASIDRFKADAPKNFLRSDRIGEAVTNVLTNPTTGQRVSVNEFDPNSLNAYTTKADYIDEGAAIGDLLDKAKLHHEAEYTKAARPGQAGMSYEMSSTRLPFADNGFGQPRYIRDDNGKQVPVIQNQDFVEQLAMGHPAVAALIKDRYQKGLTTTATDLLTGKPGVPHTIQQTALNMLRPYGSLNVKQRELSPMAVPQPRSGAGAKVIVNPNTQGAAAGVGITDGQGHPLNYSSPYVGQAPTKTKVSTGETIGFGYDGAVHNQYIRQIPGRPDEVVSNNSEPQNVQYGTHFVALTTPSGKIVRPTQHLEGQALQDWMREAREKDPRLTVETIINGSPRKGKNELGDREGIADQLTARYATRPRSEQRKKPMPTRPEILKEADDIISKQNASYQYVYRGGTKREIDNYAPGAYNGKEKAAEIEQARRQADEATRPKPPAGGSVYHRPATKNALSAPSRGGSIYKTR